MSLFKGQGCFVLGTVRLMINAVILGLLVLSHGILSRVHNPLALTTLLSAHNLRVWLTLLVGGCISQDFLYIIIFTKRWDIQLEDGRDHSVLSVKNQASVQKGVASCGSQDLILFRVALLADLFRCLSCSHWWCPHPLDRRFQRLILFFKYCESSHRLG